MAGATHARSRRRARATANPPPPTGGSKTPAAGLSVYATHYDYDLDRNLTTTTRPDAVVVNRSYDSAGRLDLLTMPSGSVDYEYYAAGCDVTSGCAPGRLASIAGPGGVTVAYEYDGHIQTEETWSGAVEGTVSWVHDADFRPVAQTVEAGTDTVTTAFGYDNDGLLVCASPSTCSPAGADALTIARSSQNGLVTGTTLGSVTDPYSYNQYGELATYDATYGATPLYSVTYDEAAAPRDELGRVVQKTETLEGTTHVYGYTYDEQGRLTDVVKDGVPEEHYEYDPNGNRTFATIGGEEVDGIYDDQDRLLSYGDTTYTYTANGELLTKTGPEGTTTYGYDAQGSLVAVDLPDGRLIEYVTDGRGRRVGKRVDGVLVRQWLYRNWLNPVAELDGSGNIVAEYVYATKAHVPDFVVRDGNTYKIVSDQLGSPVPAVNVADSADVPFRAEYSAFGEVSGDGLDWMAFGFAGGQYDADTGLLRFGARDYDPSVGRWTARDSLLFGASETNLYGHAMNDPVNRLDPTGYTSWDAYQHAEDVAYRFYPQSMHNGKGDAVKHCVASCLVAQQNGRTYSRFAGWLNEVKGNLTGQPGDEEMMDMSNDACGRSYGDEDADCDLACISAAENGYLETLY